MMWTTIVLGVQLTLIKRLKVKISGKNQVREMLVTSQLPNGASVMELRFDLMTFKEDKIANLEHPRNPNYLH